MSATIYRREVVEAALAVAIQYRRQAGVDIAKARAESDTMKRTIGFAQHATSIDIARAFEAFAAEIRSDAGEDDEA